jgi:predicted dienelactone hydrolase
MKADVLRYFFVSLAACLLAVFIATSNAIASSQASPAAVKSRDEVWRDEGRSRDIPVRIVSPTVLTAATPVILFSHGLGGSLDAGHIWAREWASHGYIVMTLQHAGSDESVWKGKPVAERAQAMKNAANARNLLLRLADVKFVLDDLTRRQERGESEWKRADLARIGMSGHSFGARTTLGVSGQTLGPLPMTADPRIKAAIAFSPNANRRAGSLDSQFANIRIPFFSLTGSRDGEILGDGTRPQDRTLPFEHMPAPDKYLAFFDGGDHSVFGGQHARNEQDRMIQSDVRALTLAFWNAHLKQDASARRWLAADASTILEPKDVFRSK